MNTDIIIRMAANSCKNNYTNDRDLSWEFFGIERYAAYCNDPEAAELAGFLSEFFLIRGSIQ